jgi:cytochrome bd-type quinol oxidase subunit 2
MPAILDRPLRALVETGVAHAGLLVLGGAYIALALAYSVMTPAWEGNDEADHVRYIEHIVAEKGLPEIAVENGVESHQPPAYYALGAAWQWALGIPAFEPDPRARSTPVVYVPRRAAIELNLDHDYSPAERINARRVHVLRGLSIVLGLGTVLTTYWIGLVALGRGELALASAAFVAFLPKFDVISSTVTNDALVVAASSAALLALLLHLRATSSSRASTWALLVGALLGVAALAKFNSLPLVAACVGAMFLARRPLRRRAADACLALGSFVVVAGWWFARNIRLYGDPLAREESNEYLQTAIPGLNDPAPWFETERFFNFVPENLVQTSWYTGGWNQLFAPFAANLALTLLAAVSIFGAGRALVHPRSVALALERRTYAAVAACAAPGLVAVVLIAKDTLQAEGRIMFVGLSAFAVLTVSGFVAATGAVSERGQRIAAFTWPTVLLIFNLYVLARYVWPLRHL